MVKAKFKQIDLLRKRRDSNFILEPYFIDNKKYINKGILSSLVLIITTLILGTPFIFRTRFLENKKEQIMSFSNEYDLLLKKLNKEQSELKQIASFNRELKNSILNISSSSALFKEIALIIPKDIQLLEVKSKSNALSLKAKLLNDEYLETLNSFLINLDKSEFIKFDDIDLKGIKKLKEGSENISYIVDIETKISTKFSDINEKYLVKVGSLGLFNRLRILKNIEETSD